MLPDQIEKLENTIGVTFTDKELIIRAMTHRSYVNESRTEEIKNNERLEFLGDAVLELVVTEHLFGEYPDRAEGELTSFRSATVRTESLAETALKLGIGEFIRMSRGEENTGGRTRPYILANTVEAIIGAIYIDQGFQSAQAFIQKNLIVKIPEIIEKRLDIDPKSKLQELSQDATGVTPAYEMLSAKGPDHDKTFVMVAMIGNVQIAEGEGKSKQEAEQSAAEKALENWDETLKKVGA